MAEPMLKENDRSRSVPTSSALVVGPNPRRKWILFVVEGANKVNLRLGAAAVVNTGIPLLGSGGSLLLDMKNTPWYGTINAIATTGASQLTVTEVETKE